MRKFRIPYSVFRIPYSVFRIPHSQESAKNNKRQIYTKLHFLFLYHVKLDE